MAKNKQTDSTSKSDANETNSPSTQPLPLFFIRPSVLDKERHVHAQLSHSERFEFTRNTNSSPINTLEFVEIGKHYPIVFTADEQSIPVAVLGWQKENYFIDESGVWNKNHYIPAYIRQYPFIFVEDPSSDRLMLAVDEAAANFSNDGSGDGEPLFVEGEASSLSKRALEYCSEFYQHMLITRNFCADLKKHNLLAPYSSKASFEGRDMELNGFLMIEEKNFNALSEEVFLEFRQKGWLPFIYFAMASASNWKSLMDRAQAIASNAK